MSIIRDLQAANMRRHQRAQTELLRSMAQAATRTPPAPVLSHGWIALHVVMTLLTGGLWSLVWAAHYWQAKQNRRRLYGR